MGGFAYTTVFKRLFNGAEGGIRTRAALRPQDFKSCVSTNSTTSAKQTRAYSLEARGNRRQLTKRCALSGSCPDSRCSLAHTTLRLSIPHAEQADVLLPRLEARGGIEPPHGGFAVPSVTTSPPSLIYMLSHQRLGQDN